MAAGDPDDRAGTMEMRSWCLLLGGASGHVACGSGLGRPRIVCWSPLAGRALRRRVDLLLFRVDLLEDRLRNLVDRRHLRAVLLHEGAGERPRGDFELVASAMPSEIVDGRPWPNAPLPTFGLGLPPAV